MRLFDPEEFNGFSVKDIHYDRPPKVKLDSGMKFYTASKFGDLVKLGRLLIKGKHVREAMKESGVKKYRAYRFARALAVMRPDLKIDFSPIRKRNLKYCKICCQCKKSFKAHKPFQNVCSPECENSRFVEHQRNYNRTKRIR